jgi:hypothetical protein
MSEQGDVELFNGPKPSEKKEGSDEKFREEMARTQQALAQLKKEEGQAKAYDNSLAAIIVQFLSKPENTDLFLLVSRTVAQNVPSELIIAILSLIDKKSHDETKGYLETGKQNDSKEETALALPKTADFESLSPAHKKAIDKWVSSISQVAAKKPHRALETIVIPGPERELSSVVVQLSAFILRNYLAKHETAIEFQILRDFMEGVFLEIVKNLEELVKEQKQLN